MLFHICKTTDNTEKGQYQKTIIEFPFWRDEKLSAFGVMCLFSIVGPVNQKPFLKKDLSECPIYEVFELYE